MSLINQVLKDLDKRSSASETGKLLTGEVRNVPVSKRGMRQIAPIVLLLAVAGGGGFFAWKKYFQPTAPVAIPVVSVVQAPPPVIPPPVLPVSAPEPVAAPVSAPALAPSSPTAEVAPIPTTSVPPSQVAPGKETASQSPALGGVPPLPHAEASQPVSIAGGAAAAGSAETALSASATGVLLSLDFPNSIKYKVFSLSGPNRVVVDLEGVGLTPALEQLPKKLTSTDSEIADIRVGRFTPTVTRIVIGLKGALPEVKSSMQPAGNGGQRLLVQWGKPVNAEVSADQSSSSHMLGMEKELKPRPSSAKTEDGMSGDKAAAKKTGSTHLRASRTLSSMQDSSTGDSASSSTGKPRREKPAAVHGGSSEPLKVVSGQQRSDNLYRQAVAMIQQGRVVEAKEALRQSLSENPDNHSTRQLLVAMLVEESQQSEAIGLLNEGLKRAPEQLAFRMALARLQVEASDRRGALATLQEGLQYAGDDAEYNGFLAALLQREDRHDEAIAHYLVALKGNPAMPSWLIGIGISLQNQGKLADASEAFARAKHTGGLTAELTQFVDQRMGQIKQLLQKRGTEQ